MKILVFCITVIASSIVYADKYTVTPQQVEGVTNIVCGLGGLFSKSACGDLYKPNNPDDVPYYEECKKNSKNMSQSKMDDCIEVKKMAKAREEQQRKAAALAEEQEKLRAEKREQWLKAEEEKNKDRIEKEQQKQISNQFFDSAEYNKMVAVYKFLDASRKITDAKNEQQRQKDIAEQSGYINQSVMYNTGVTIVDSTKAKDEAFNNYRKLGGTAANPIILDKRHNQDCNMANWLYAVVGASISGVLDKEQRDSIILASTCY